jgi:type 1 glutamine amidotransferase
VLAFALAGAGCGGDLGGRPPSPADAGYVDEQPAPPKDTGVPETAPPDAGGGSSDADASSMPAGDAPSVDVTAPPDVGPDVPAPPDAHGASDAEAGAPPKINVLAIGELVVNGGPEIHAPFVMAAKTWLATQTNLTVTHVESPNTITDALLANYGLILQLNYTPWRWNATAKAAFEKYVTEGRGGWVGMHHAGLYGPAVSQETWPWFFTFFGQINYKNYIASFAEGTVHVEESTHAIFNGVPASFVVTTDEWYTWDKSPRPNVHVLANVDENSYKPTSNIKMGDHPVIWTNEAYKGKNLYIFMGHHPNLFQNPAYVTLLKNAINWAGTPK